MGARIARVLYGWVGGTEGMIVEVDDGVGE